MPAMRYPVWLTILPGLLLTGCQPPPLLKGTANWDPDAKHATVLADEEKNGNGIDVGAPKIYDDASLRMMLDATRATLATMSGLSQSALTASLGSVSGATISQSQFGFQVSGPTAPSTATTNTGATTQTTNNANLPQGNTTVPGTVTVTTDPTQSSTVTTTVTPPTAPAVASGLAFTPPGTIAPSSLDMLNEQMQLSAAITGYALLLEGALSDRFVTDQRIIKPRVTLGFPISLRTPAAYKDAVAVVEVEATTSAQNLSADPPAITALLPQEKTYNVAAMTDNMSSVGAGVVVGTVGVGASYLWGHKTFYLVQDQDTVALQRPPSENPNATSFLWEFHPVLGQHYVRVGMKQTFVQLALPILPSKDCYGTVRIRTYWRKFDQDTGLVGDVVPGSVLVSHRAFPLPRYDLAPEVAAINYEDLGDGTVSVTVSGRYLSGTYVQVGPVRYDAGRNLVIEDAGAKFSVPAAALAQWTGHIVARSGQASELLTPLAQSPLAALHQTACVSGSTPANCVNSPALSQGAAPPQEAASPRGTMLPQPATVECPQLAIHADVTSLNETDSLVRIRLSTAVKDPKDLEKLLVVAGNKVFGLRDAPVVRGSDAEGPYLEATIPTATLVASPKIRVFAPFWSDVDGDGTHCYDATQVLNDQFGPESAVEHLVLVSLNSAGDASYLLYGNGLEHASLLVPDKSAATLKALDHVSSGNMKVLTVKKAALQTTKKIVLQKADSERPLVLDLPPAKATPIKVSADSPVIQGTQELDVQVERPADITSVKLNDKLLHWKIPDKSKSSIRLLTLKADGVTNEQRSCQITIQYKNGDKATLKLDVVAARINVKMADKPAASDASAQD